MGRRLYLCLLSLVVSPALAAAGEDRGEAPDNSPDSSGDIVVTARQLDAARDSIQPSLGAGVTTLDRAALDALPGGADRDLNDVLLQVPGVSANSDPDAAIHIRNEHGNVQYRLNGVTVPEGISGFGPFVDTRIAQSIAVITGALPAQYGFRTAGVVELRTRSGAFDAGGDVGIYGGGNGTIQPSATWRNAFGRFNLFVSASYLQSDLGIANPTPERDAIHDRTRQWRGFGYASLLLGEASRISLFGGSTISKFQIPNRPGQTPQFVLEGRSQFASTLLDQNQRNQTHFAVLPLQFSGERLDVQLAPFVNWSRARFVPDPAGGELMFNGADTDLTQTNLAWGAQADASLKAGDRHTVRFGLFYQHERNSTASINRVFALDTAGNQASDRPIVIPVSLRSDADSLGLYLQDEWKLADDLTLNYGLRYDYYRGEVSEGMVSPRLNLVWKASTQTTLHLGYARNFTPPPLALIGVGSLAAFAGTTGEAEVLTADPIRAEREHLFDIGVEQKLGSHLTVGIDGYYKIKRNLLDNTQFGATELFAPFNYADARGWGVELSLAWENGPLTAYANLARGAQKAKRIISNQFFFEQEELDYIERNYILTDHSQDWTASAGAALKIANPLGELQPSLALIYGSGLRAGDPAGLVPNGGKEEAYVQVDLGFAQTIGADKDRALTLRFDVTNLFDRVYLAHEGSGVGGGQPQYGPRRAFFVGLRKAF